MIKELDAGKNVMKNFVPRAKSIFLNCKHKCVSVDMIE